jgi:hypothetical protein
MALILKEVFVWTKSYGRHQGVTIISPPLFSFEQHSKSGMLLDRTSADYLRDVYRYGQSDHSWQWVRDHFHSPPFDAVGYHIYVAQSPGSQPRLISTITAHLQAMDEVLTEHGDAHLKFFVTEVGFPNSHSQVPQERNRVESFVASSLKMSLEFLLRHPRVEYVGAFCLHDCPAAPPWGLYDLSFKPRPALDAFREVAHEHRL